MRLSYLTLLIILIISSISYGNNIYFTLIKDSYAPNMSLQGYLNLNLTEELDLGIEPLISLKLGNFKESRNIIDILKKADSNLNIVENAINATGPSSQKNILLRLDPNFGFRLPKGSNVENLDFDIEGLNDNGFPNSPFIDFDNNNINDWFYGGTFSSWSTETIGVKGLSNTKTSDVLIRDNSLFYCGLINLSFSNVFKLVVDVETQDNAGNISLHIFDFDETTKIARDKKGECTLTDTLNTNSLECTINTDNYIQGDYLVCFYNDINEGRYALAADDRGEGSYSCDSSLIDTGQGSCNVGSGDFFIKAYKPVYNGDLNKKVNFSYYGAKDDVISYMNSYLSNCKQDSNNECVIHLKSGSKDNKGILKINNLKLEYKKPDQITYILDNFYNIETLNAKIIGLKNGNFANYNLNFSLDIFHNLTIPNISANTSTLKLNATLAGLTATKDIIVDKTLADSTKGNILNAKESLTSIKTNTDLIDFVSILDLNLDNLILSLSNYEKKLDNIGKNNSLSSNEKFVESEKINDQVDELLKTAPETIDLVQETEYQRIPPTAIDDSLLDGETQEDILSLQGEVTFDNKIKVFEINYFNGSSKEHTLVKRSLTSSLNDYSIIEVISKEVEDNASDIKFLGTSFTVIKDDPIIKWSFNGAGEVVYLIDGNVLGKIDKITSIVLAKKSDADPIIPPIETECGNNICTETLEDSLTCPEDCKPQYEFGAGAWILFILLFLVLVGGLVYIFVFMKKKPNETNILKENKKTETKQPLKPNIDKPLFNSETDETNLTNYIIKSLSNKVSKTDIYNLLLSKKWTNKQIDYIFKKIDNTEHKRLF